MEESEKRIRVQRISARVFLHWEDAPLDPGEAAVRFCDTSFEEVTQTLMGDAHPRQLAFVVFDQIDPPLAGVAGVNVDCSRLAPTFAFGHELVHLSSPLCSRLRPPSRKDYP